MKDLKTTITGVLCGVIMLIMTFMFLTKKIDNNDFVTGLGAIGAFGITLIGIFSKDRIKED